MGCMWESDASLRSLFHGLYVVGGIIICYETHLPSLVLRAREFHQGYLIYNNLLLYKIWISRIAPNSVVPISENPINSYDSDGVILIFISALGNEKQKMPFSLFTCSFSGSPGRIRTYDMSLERHFQRESSTVGIVGNGSVGMELFEEQV